MGQPIEHSLVVGFRPVSIEFQCLVGIVAAQSVGPGKQLLRGVLKPMVFGHDCLLLHGLGHALGLEHLFDDSDGVGDLLTIHSTNEPMGTYTATLQSSDNLGAKTYIGTCIGEF